MLLAERFNFFSLNSCITVLLKSPAITVCIHGDWRLEIFSRWEPLVKIDKVKCVRFTHNSFQNMSYCV